MRDKYRILNEISLGNNYWSDLSEQTQSLVLKSSREKICEADVRCSLMRHCPWTCIFADLEALIRRRAVVGEEHYLDSRFKKGAENGLVISVGGWGVDMEMSQLFRLDVSLTVCI